MRGTEKRLATHSETWYNQGWREYTVFYYA